MSFQTSRKSCNFGLLFKNIEEKNRVLAHRKLSSWSEDHCVMETLKSYYPERSKICFFNEFKYQRKCSSQLFDNLNHAASRFPFIIRSAGRKT